MKKVLIYLQLVTFVFLASCGLKNNKSERITIDYSKSINQLVFDGHYNCVAEIIESPAFQEIEPIPNAEMTQTVILINFSQPSITSDEIIRQMKLQGLRPGTAKELYTVGALYPELQIEKNIVALGSILATNKLGEYVPVLWYEERNARNILPSRVASLFPLSSSWGGKKDWFLAVRNQ